MDVCSAPSPRKRFSPSSVECMSDVNAQLHPNNQYLSLTKAEPSGSLQNTDEAGDRLLGVGGGAEWDPDMGYCSHSTSSSCHYTEQGTELDYCQSNQSDCSDVEYNGFVQGTDKMEDVVQHFGNYFQGQFHQVLHHLKTSVHSILNEQQDHLRHIIDFVGESNQNSSENLHDEKNSLPFNEESNSQVLPLCTSTAFNLEEMDALPPIDDNEFSDFYWTPETRQPDQSQSSYISEFQSSLEQPCMSSVNQTLEEPKERLLLHVFSLTCDVNNLLHKPEFKT
ncbi:uncharacterized protein LOC125675950 [Ostrea edulis]|uniref:uncharacterized protein LOC125675950 n=1 Tax=Ostrea edulis TaxID=37623 RepID=UPI0024AFCB14|nr:uncharacterized protein LOC125675950 [Ostrea edulis]XP_048769768.2 uncharacterized protein LOC125675950 [Ostrea edulis]